MPNRQELLSVVSDNGLDYEKLLLMLFKNYEAKKKNGSLYSMREFDPQGLIKMYYQIVDKPKFDGLMENFRKKYIQNENQLEQVHEKWEIEGLGEVYDYIQSDIPISNINIFIMLKLHILLYSHATYPEFGGKFRNQLAYLPGTDINTESWDGIPKAFSRLFEPTNELIREGLRLGESKDTEQIIEYINKAIKLKVEIVRIHPFNDGNGRTARAFLNLMFKLAGVPPTYITVGEKAEYLKAMNKAYMENDFSAILRFYYYKICDSIFELDIKEKMEQQDEQLENIKSK